MAKKSEIRDALQAGAVLAVVADPTREVLGTHKSHVGDAVRGTHDTTSKQHVAETRVVPHGCGDVVRRQRLPLAAVRGERGPPDGSLRRESSDRPGCEEGGGRDPRRVAVAGRT
jgi:hypothetical protein